MTIPAQFRSPRYNKLKRLALEIFDRHGGWLRPGDWAVIAAFYPIRASYSYLKRLHHFGLLDRDSTSESVSYRLSDKGRERLCWLARTLR
jgi:DNA-binding transcriptional regulator PaaX